MDFTESTKVVYNRIQKLDPENVSKIIGYLLLRDHGEREMIRLAFSPDKLIYSLITKAKSDLGLNKPPVSTPISPSQVSAPPVSDVPLQFAFPSSSSSPASSLATHRAVSPYWDAQLTGDQEQMHNLDFIPPGYPESVAEDHLQNQMQFLTLDDQLELVNSDFCCSYFYNETASGPRTNRRSPSLPEFPVKVCHYFVKGFCKHGNNCRYFHGRSMPESFSQILSSNSNEIATDEHVISPGSLQKLEFELTELLKSRRGMPVSIAALPMIYYERYGRSIHAEGYLTESQRHGKAGYSLTKLLAQLKDSIRLIDRPHGQHSVVLADAAKYLEHTGERNDPGGIVDGSRQIYLTFPAESTFTEQDVSNYFSKFGLVQDVRIPCQQKRMFGFVSFAFAETVKQILAKGNPHFVCGARVLVKPYKEKSRLVDRKCIEKMHHPLPYGLHFMDPDSELHSNLRVCDNSRLRRKQLVEEHEQALELESMRLSELQLAPTPFNRHSYFGNSMGELKRAQGLGDEEFASAERFDYFLNVLNNGSTSDKKLEHMSTNYSEQERYELTIFYLPVVRNNFHDHECCKVSTIAVLILMFWLLALTLRSGGANLPESPFASAIGGSGISTVI